MAKKIYDIVPPKKVSQLRESLKKSSTAVPVKRRVRPQREVTSATEERTYQPSVAPSYLEKKRRFPILELLIGGGVILLLVGIYLLITLPKAEIALWPTLEPITLEEKVTIDIRETAVDLDESVIPGFFVEEELSGDQEFPVTGVATNDGKATGSMTIYNKVSPSEPLTLKVGTHFLSDSGKYFVTLDRVTIPAATKNGPGSVAVKVQAEEVGKEHNIGPSKFSVPKLAGTIYYYGIYGESTESMAGGYTGQVKKVTKNDLDGAQDTLTKRLFASAEAALKAKLSQDQVLLDGTMEREIVTTSASAKADDVTESFQQQAKIKVSGLVFNKQDMDAVVAEAIQSQIDSDQTFLGKSLEVTHAPQIIDLKSGVAEVDLSISAKIHNDINTQDVLDVLSEKSEGEVRDVVTRLYGSDVSRVDVVFWPFWVSSVPKDASKVTVHLNFE